MISELQSSNDPVIYRGKIRDGAWGRWSSEDFEVRHHAASDVAYLSPFPQRVKDFYASAEYRSQYNASNEIQEYYRLHDGIQKEKLTRLDLHDYRGKVVGDFGCGGGVFLDLLRGIASETVGVEPNPDFAQALRNKGHQGFQWAEEVMRSRPGTLDRAVSFDAIEHVENPIEFLRQIRECLKPGGRLIVSTDNRNELLFQLKPKGFEEFYYRTAHLWYFTEKSLRIMGEAAGFRVMRTFYQQCFDLGNMMRWMEQGKPCGNGTMATWLDASLESHFSQHLEKQGWANLVYLEYERVK